MRALALLAAVPVLMWLGQAVLLRAAGQPLRLRLSSAGLPRRYQRVARVWTNACLALAVLAYPLLLGRGIVEYYAALFPARGAAAEALHGFAGPVIYLACIYLGWILTGNACFERRHPWPTLLGRVAGVPLSALLGATIEELLFRGVVMADLLRTLPLGAAVAIGAVIFAGAHYVRRVKRYWTLPGHLALGVLLCVSFAATRTLWLPIGVHAGGIFMIMGARPFMRYLGPSWLVGASIFPYAGVIGIAGLSLLTLNVWLNYGVAS